MSKSKAIIVFILGPTGVGKSNFAAALAKKIGGEIISCDSMQIYKGMTVISQQPSLKLRKAVPHHLVGILSPSEEWSAASFIEEAKEIVEDIIERKKIPIVVGGTGLYARAFIKGLFPSPPKSEKLRKAIYEEAKKKGKKKLYEILLKIDPAYASKIHPNDLRRIVRALEVYKLTGKPISEKHLESIGIEAKYKILIFVLNRERNELYRRIDERVEKLFDRGIIREVKRLLRQKLSQTAKAVLGYREVSDYIKGKCNLDKAKELLKKNTRHYAKRQLTWFRKEKNAKRIELSTRERDSELFTAIVKQIKVASTNSKKTSIEYRTDLSTPQ